MHARMNPPGVGGPGLRALYSVDALAAASGVGRKTMTRMLRAQGLQFVYSGRSFMIPLCEIQRCFPALWDSMLAVEQLRAEAAAAAAAATTAAIATQ
jgi:hypothetical protein